MNEKLLKNSLINAEIDPTIVMDLSIIQIGGWNNLLPRNPKLLECIGDNEP